MSNNRKKRKQGRKDGFIERLFAKTKIPAHMTEEPDWFLDSPDVRLTRVFTIVLILHVVAVGGILAFKMVEKASAPTATLVDSLSKSVETPVAKIAEPDAAPAAPVLKETAMPDILTRKDDAPVVMDHPSADGYREYRVVMGDTVSSVARKMNVQEDGLRELNQLGPRDSLPSGKWLLVPKENAAPTAEKAAAIKIADTPPEPKVEKKEQPLEDKQISRISKPAEKKVAEKPVEKKLADKPPVKKAPVKKTAQETPNSYKVQKGDTPYGIARRFGIDLKNLMAANGINKPENLRAGQTVVIPK